MSMNFGAIAPRNSAACGFAALLIATVSIASGGSIFDDNTKPAPKPQSAQKPADVAPEPSQPNPSPPSAADQPSSPVSPPANPATAPIVFGSKPRLPIPDAAQQEKAEKLIRDLFAPEYRLHTPAAKASLAHSLLSEAGQESNRGPTLYVLLREARALAISGGSVADAVEACRRIRDNFINASTSQTEERGSLLLAAHALAGFPTNSVTPDFAESAVQMTMEAAESDFAEGRFASAAELGALADSVLRHGVEPGLAAAVRERVERFTFASGEYSRLKVSFATLASNPEDPAANLACGRFYALLLDQPEAGFRMLAKGSDAAWKAVAVDELRNPDAANAQVALAEAWTALCKTTPLGPKRDATVRRAVYWFGKALDNLKGLERAVAQRHIVEVSELSVRRGLQGEYFRGLDLNQKVLTRVDPRIEFNWNGKPPCRLITAENFSAQWTGFIKAPAPGRYIFEAVHDDGMRMWIDGESVIDFWDDARTNRSAPIVLTGALQSFRIDFRQGGGDSRMILKWIPSYATDPVSIPIDAFYHVPASVEPFPPPVRLSGGVITLMPQLGLICSDRHLRFSTDHRHDHVEHWESKAERMSWEVQSAEGDYDVAISYADDNLGEGSVFEFGCESGTLKCTAQDTGGWDDYTSASIGRLHLSAGRHLVTARAIKQKKEGRAMMDLGPITLTPASAKK